ncbi:Arylsulphatase A [Planctomycetales bacterium 10988]|nr:Arylsulphatase A [Planctomycetales bacterium 10988]
MRTGAMLLVMTLLTGVLSAAPQEESKPNIIFIMADDFGRECLSCYGSTSYQTPAIDRLAKTGIRFEECHSQPLCTPTRVKLMTGLYNFRNYEDFGYLKPTETTFGHVLQKAGYKTAIAGKWQLNGLTYEKPNYQDPNRVHEAGFDRYCLWQLTAPKKEGERYKSPLIEQSDGETHELKTFDDEYGPDIFCDFLLDFIEDSKDEPFFVYYPMVLTHGPFVPTPDTRQFKNRQQRNNPKWFPEMVSYTDKTVDRIVKHLKKLGLRENTYIFFTGDNGTPREITTETTWGTVPGGKGLSIDRGTHVPLIVSCPTKIPARQVSKDLIDFTDHFVTFMELAGIPQDSIPTRDGQSYAPQLAGKAGTPREWLFCYYEPKWGKFRRRDVSARDHHFKLYEDGRFYRLTEDPDEKNPIPQEDLSAEEKAIYQKLDGVINQFELPAPAESVVPQARRNSKN